MKFENASEILRFMNNFNKMYDIIRIVDPVSKSVIHYNDIGEKEYTSICYEYWKNGRLCENCVSARAVNEEETFVKVEYNKDKIYLVMASPAKVNESNYIVEMLKDITETGIVPDLKGKTIDEINDIIVQLNKEIITDELTQAYNRRYLNERLPVDIYTAFNDKTELSVIMFDIDLFKSFNDKYGHLAGDKVLRVVSDTIKSKIRKDHDWVARFGGEEFLISLPNADKKVSRRIAEEIRKEIENKEIEYGGGVLKVTVSGGVYSLDSNEITMEKFIDIVDKHMYKAKCSGRNCISVN